jgi:hypothetical protein
MGGDTEDRAVHSAAVQISVSFNLKFSSSRLRKIRFATDHPERNYFVSQGLSVPLNAVTTIRCTEVAACKEFEVSTVQR